MIDPRKSLSMQAELRGALVTLKRVGPKGADALQQLFADPSFCQGAGLSERPAIDKLRMRLEKQTLMVWEIWPEGEKKAVGVAGFVRYAGPSYVISHFQPDQFEINLFQDAMLQLVHLFFQQGSEPYLFYYARKPTPDEVHSFLVEGGFDPIPELSTIDNTKEAAYVLQRYTYDAYYSEGGEDEGELDV